jgi:hypothetical protein
MKTLLTNWNAGRILRIILGAGIAVQGIRENDVLFVLAGVVLLIMAVANAGCCGVDGCNVNLKEKTAAEKSITYEEVDRNK